MYTLFQLLKHGVGLSTGTDSELITQLLTHTPECGEPHGANWIGRYIFEKKKCKFFPTKNMRHELLQLY